MSHSETKKILKYIKKGSVSRLRSFLKKNDVNINEIRDLENRGVLHLSCHLGEAKMSKFLLRCGVDPCMTDNDGNTPIHVALKYALEFNNESVFLNLIIPLKKKSKRIMNLRNNLGETPEELLGELQKGLREEMMEKGKNEMYENKFEVRGSVKREEEEEWFEKLAYEESCQDFYFKENHDLLSGEQDENYNEWAERIRCEYRTKHQRVVTQSLATKGKEKQQQSTTNETLTKKLAKEHEEYVRKVQLKRNKRDKEKYEQNCQNVFESGETGQLSFETIPWPCAGSAADVVDKLSEWAGDDKIAYLKVQRIRWHPDKFAQRCRDRIKVDERERVMDLVKQISQGINVMLSSL